ncbi:hypothetical protein MOQ72_34255 [Saccharopolyspora sp. K220]|uniref:hypothetical protein n=1 Tax=Saccharopolyspora soli TaxID=2926618 RepID=UPI001F57B82A|nr:hypothetical protein [Saccharopolyspora soli]MCI2422503.1 hypothetical protein [Saccharopolyspora soli]
MAGIDIRPSVCSVRTARPASASASASSRAAAARSRSIFSHSGAIRFSNQASIAAR